VSAFVHVTPLPAVSALTRLTYAVPEPLRGLVGVGVRVVVPLGPRRVTALVVGSSAEAPEGVTCRPIISLMDDCPIVPEKLLALLEWMAEYYLAPVGETLSLAIGRALTTSSHRIVVLRDAAAASEDALERRIVEALSSATKPLTPAGLAQAAGRRTIDRVLHAMARRGAIAIDDVMAAPRAKTQYETAFVVQRMPDEAMRRRMIAYVQTF